MHTIKPLDKEALKKAAETTKLLITIEEHSIIGGLGSAVSEYISTSNENTPLEIIGLPDKYGDSGAYKDLLEHQGLSEQQLANTILNRLKSIKK